MLAFQQQVGGTSTVLQLHIVLPCMGVKSYLVNFDADEVQRHLEQCFQKWKAYTPHISLFINVELGKHVFSDVYCVDSLKVLTLGWMTITNFVLHNESHSKCSGIEFVLVGIFTKDWCKWSLHCCGPVPHWAKKIQTQTLNGQRVLCYFTASCEWSFWEPGIPIEAS